MYFRTEMADTELIIKIINAVKLRDCLWNVHSPEYAKRDKLEKAWQEVADDVGRADVFCREKWRNVRTGFLRSIQYNSVDKDDSIEDLPTPRRKRFYLYNEMKFLLPSTAALGQTKKRRKFSRSIKHRNPSEDGSGIYSDNTSTMNTYALNENTEHYNNNQTMPNNGSNYSELFNELKLVANTTKTAAGSPNSGIIMKISAHSKPLKVDEARGDLDVQTISTVAPKCEVENTTENTETFKLTSTHNDCDERDEQQLLAFFRGNIDDILSLPKHKQRLFKRRMLELIDDLHRPANDIATNRFC